MSNTTLAVRADDPDTSYEAAMKAALGASKVRPVVLEIVRENGPLTHDQLIGEYHKRLIITPDTPRASESGIRTRLRELVKAGLIVEDTMEGQSLFGNRAKRWIAVDMIEGLFSEGPDQELVFADADVDAGVTAEDE